jgi:UDP-N-acetylglucosamine 4-epimerase
MMRGKRPTVEWDGRQSRDFTFVRNVVEANLKACVTPGISGEVFNVACGRTTSIIDIVKSLNRILNSAISPRFAPKRQGDVRKTYGDISKLKRMMKIKEFVQFEEGLKFTVDWFLKFKGDDKVSR